MIVFVYRNLNKNCWSVRAAEGKDKGRLIAHTDKIILKDCMLTVSEKGRKRVLKDRRRNVHAFIKGTVIRRIYAKTSKIGRIYYNPYRNETFIMNNKSIIKSEYVYFKYDECSSYQKIK